MANRMLHYLAAPYSHEDPFVVQRRLLDTARCAGELFKRNIHCFVPTLMCHAIKSACHGLDGSFDTWKSFNYRMLDICDILLVLNLTGSYRSQGVRAEINYFLNRKPVYIVSPINFSMEEYNADNLL